MIGLDTNVIIAWMTARSGRRLVAGETYRISHVALSEFVWVLENRFNYTRRDVVKAVRALRETRNVVFDRPESVRAAIDAFEQGGADFPDFMIAHDNLAAGCSTTLTLDVDASRKPGFTLLRT